MLPRAPPPFLEQGLPKKVASALAVLNDRLKREDGDRDGTVSDIELLRGLSTVAQGVTPSDWGFLCKFLSSKYKMENGSMGIADIADWFTQQPGGVERARTPAEDALPSAPETETDRIVWSNHKFAAFRSAWEDKHGAAAKKEFALDAAVPAAGPTWTRAHPSGFRVLHLSSAPPPSPAA